MLYCNLSLINCRSGTFKPFPKPSGGAYPMVSGSIPLISTKRLAFIRQVSFFAKKGGVRVYASLLVKLFSIYRVLELCITSLQSSS